MNCVECGKEKKETDRACPHCGVEQERELPPELAENKARESANKNEVCVLAGRAMGGDDSVWGEIYEKTHRYVYYMTLKFLHNEQDAQDVAQEVYIQAIRSIGQLYTADSFFGWLRSIVYSKCKDLVKKKKPILLDDNEDGSSPLDEMPEISENFIPDMALDNAESRRMILELIDALPYLQRQAVMFYYYDEMTVDQIAAQMECPAGTVKSRLNYARQQIKKGVEEHEKKGVKLYGAAVLPILSILLREQAATLPIPGSLSGGLGTILGTAVGTTAGATAGTTAGTTAGATAGTAAGTTAGTTAGAAAGSAAAGATEAGAAAGAGTAAGTTAGVGTAAGASASAGVGGSIGSGLGTAVGGAAAKAGISLVTKIIAGVVATGIVAGGGVLLVTNIGKDNGDADTIAPTASISAPLTTGQTALDEPSDAGDSADEREPPEPDPEPEPPAEESYYDTLSDDQKKMLSRLEAALRVSDYETAHIVQKSNEFVTLCDEIPDWGGFWYYPDDETSILICRWMDEIELSYDMSMYIGRDGNGSYRFGKYVRYAGTYYYILHETTYTNSEANGAFAEFIYDYTNGSEPIFYIYRGNLEGGKAYGNLTVFSNGEETEGVAGEGVFDWWPEWPQ